MALDQRTVRVPCFGAPLPPSLHAATHARPRICTAPQARVSGVTRRARVRAPRTTSPPDSPSAPSVSPAPVAPSKLAERYLVRDAHKGELYTVADVRCEAFYQHPTDPYFYPMRRREIYTALVERVSGGSRCLVVVDTDVPAEWRPFCARDGSMVVASLDLTLHHADSGKRTFFGGKERWEGKMRFYVSSMAVRVDWRRRGLAKQLLRAVDRIAGAMGIEEVFLHVDWENEAAVKLYCSEGFEKVEQRKRVPEWLGFLAKREHTLLGKRLVVGGNEAEGKAID